MKEFETKCCISGSISKYKPEIDKTIDEFLMIGIRVLAPAKGWIVVPKTTTLDETKKFRRLPGEEKMLIRQIEDDFLSKISMSDFLFIENCEGYLGNSTSFEIGFAIAKGIPVFLRKKVSNLIDLDPFWKNQIDKLQISSPNEIKSLLIETGE
jgi:hypothetical protein